MNSPRLKTNGISDTRLPEFPNHSFSKHSALLSIALAASVSGCSRSSGAYTGGGTVWEGEVRKTFQIFDVELGLKGNRNMYKVAVYSSFVVILPHEAPKHCPECSSALGGRWGCLSPPWKRRGLRESQEGLWLLLRNHGGGGSKGFYR